MRPLIRLAGVTATRAAGGPAVRGVTWAWRPGESWAVVGPVGSGKTAFVETLLGRHRVTAGVRELAVPESRVAAVSFKEESRLFSYGRHYYQQRFESLPPEDGLTLEDYLRAGTAADVRGAAERLGVGALLPLEFIKLSNGQVRRARIARAMLAEPALLLLDEPFVGLDAAGRVEVAELLGRTGAAVLLVARPEEVPGWVTHVLELEGLAVKWQGRRKDRASGGLAPPASGPANPAANAPRSPDREVVAELRNVTVRYGDRVALDGVTWAARAGERWAVTGPNGSGKTTLLALLCGDHPQAYSNDVRLFGHRRGSGESVWDVKRRVGLVSPELHLYFAGPLTAVEAAATGFSDTLAPRRVTLGQAAAVRELLAAFGLADADRPFGRLSTGEQRLALLARALVKRPPLVILDEPFQALDAASVGRVTDWLGANLGPEQTLLFVTHVPAEVPPWIDRHLRLDVGRVVAGGQSQGWL